MFFRIFFIVLSIALIATNSVSAAVVLPPKTDSWLIQLQKPAKINANSAIIVTDLFDTSTAIITHLKNNGKYVICYFSAGSYENWRPDASLYPAATLGN